MPHFEPLGLPSFQLLQLSMWRTGFSQAWPAHSATGISAIASAANFLVLLRARIIFCYVQESLFFVVANKRVNCAISRPNQLCGLAAFPCGNLIPSIAISRSSRSADASLERPGPETVAIRWPSTSQWSYGSLEYKKRHRTVGFFTTESTLRFRFFLGCANAFVSGVPVIYGRLLRWDTEANRGPAGY